jgi:hypothetical protein
LYSTLGSSREYSGLELLGLFQVHEAMATPTAQKEPKATPTAHLPTPDTKKGAKDPMATPTAQQVFKNELFQAQEATATPTAQKEPLATPTAHIPQDTKMSIFMLKNHHRREESKRKNSPMD